MVPLLLPVFGARRVVILVTTLNLSYIQLPLLVPMTSENSSKYGGGGRDATPDARCWPDEWPDGAD